ncbi:cell division protein FtsQ/DivIB [Heyndrickxia sp. NPDC080065]|uniref:cell division protein FtsQ/DivIB n=1 Tax=Heyndrickxia sp. NPDC080065 TaxID=3390568 RepID=UPI003D0412F1
MPEGKIVSLEDRIPKLKEQRKRKTNRRLIFLISLFFLLILFVVYFQSPLSHVRKITVEGNQTINKKLVLDKSGISTKTNIWNIDKEKIASKITNIPEIKKAKVKVLFPNNIVINIKERATIAYISEGTKLLPVLENGSVLDNQQDSMLTNVPILTSFNKGKILTEMVNQLQQLPDEIINSISEIHYSPKKTDTYHITLYMNDGFEVSATIRTLAEKIIHYPSIISQLDPNVKGIIDLEVGSFFKAFKAGGKEKDEKNKNER